MDPNSNDNNPVCLCRLLKGSAGPGLAAGRAWCTEFAELGARVKRAQVRAYACRHGGDLLIARMEEELHGLLGALMGKRRALPPAQLHVVV